MAPSVVIIEEDSLVRGLIKEWVSAAGYAVCEGALPAKDAGDNADLVIVDLYMPRRAGAEIVRAVQRAHPRAPVIAISAQFGSGVSNSSRAAHALGAERLIAKPFSREELLVAVRAAVGPAR